ncbi:MAG: M1 family metallopeptidase, partial [Bacteroidota bacterium]
MIYRLFIKNSFNYRKHVVNNNFFPSEVLEKTIDNTPFFSPSFKNRTFAPMKTKGLITLILLLIFTLFSLAQKYDPLHPPNTYRNTDNPQYWKNRKPHESYWQQDVHYIIKANIDENTDIIDGSLELTYWNNSPDELTHVFFHLYQNAFQPDSYYDNLQKNNNRNPIYGKYEKQKLGTVVEKISIDKKEIKSELDNTILKAFLSQPLKSGESITFYIKFKTYFDIGGVRRRMKTFNSFGYKHYNGVHWYPRIAVYDRKFGWTTDQHLGHEFYGDFGTYDVELSFANNFIVGATGFLVNREEVLPAELRKKLDIKNFADNTWNTPPSVIIPYDSLNRKTWKYHAENVHDFAFTADPTYRIGEAECLPAGLSSEALAKREASAQVGQGIKCIALVQEPHASRWQSAAEYTAKIVRVYSEDFGMYVYHKMIVADARDGMEYPMMTLVGGSDPGYRWLFAHEVGHNWFYGQVGNNETYRAALDEGFTQFLTIWFLEKVEGNVIVKLYPKSKYLQRFSKPEKLRESRLYYPYISKATKGITNTLNTHSDDFGGKTYNSGGYRQVYCKAATMLYNLQYVLGDELFLKAMQHYFEQWKICHPYFIDFRNSIIQYTKADLNWFFDQWLETSKTIDYAVKSISPSPALPPVGGEGDPSLEKPSLSKEQEVKNEYEITFKRKGGMQMPIDFQVSTQDGNSYQFHIPNTWFVKKTNATVLPKWFGWGNLHPI